METTRSEITGGRAHDLTRGAPAEHKSLEECLRREIMEELGVEVEVGQEIETITWPYPERTVVLHFFRCALAGGDVYPRERQAMAWATPEELQRYTSLPPTPR